MKLKTILSTSGCIAVNTLLIQKQLHKKKHTNRLGYRGGGYGGSPMRQPKAMIELVEEEVFKLPTGTPTETPPETPPETPTETTDFCEKKGLKVLDKQLPSNFSFVFKNSKNISSFIIKFIAIVITYIILTPRLYRFALGSEKIIGKEESPKQKTILRITVAAIVFSIVKLFLDLLLTTKRSFQYGYNQVVKNRELVETNNLIALSQVFLIPLFMITQPGLIYRFDTNGKLKWGRSKNYDFVSEFIHANVYWLLGVPFSDILIRYPLESIVNNLLNLKDNYKKPLPKCWEEVLSKNILSTKHEKRRVESDQPMDQLRTKVLKIILKHFNEESLKQLGFDSLDKVDLQAFEKKINKYNLEGLSFDSLDKVELQMSLEKEFKIKFSENENKLDTGTVNEIIQEIKVLKTN